MKLLLDKKQNNKNEANGNAFPKKQDQVPSAARFKDNRPEAIAQRKLQKIINHSPQVLQQKTLQKRTNGSLKTTIQGQYRERIAGKTIQRARKPKSRKDDDPTWGGPRLVGDSRLLAANRYHRDDKDDDFKDWKKGREAQHLIPASLHKFFPALTGIVDDEDNGMMLPSVLDTSNTKVTHRKPKHRDHPAYTRNVKKLILEVNKTQLNINQSTLRKVMHALRPVNKMASDYDYLDEIPYSEFEDSWNKQNPSNKI